MADTIWTYNGRIPTLGGGGRIPYFDSSYTPTDSDAINYITRVETADAEPLEDGVKRAIDEFFISLKDEGIFGDIQTGCLLAGPRTLAGIIEPLVGTMSPSYGVGGAGPSFSISDYNRKTGLRGTGNGGSDGAHIDADFYGFISNDNHQSCYVGESQTNTNIVGYVATKLPAPPNGIFQIYGASVFGFRSQTTSFNNSSVSSTTYTGFIGQQRDDSTHSDVRINSTTTQYNNSSTTINNSGVYIFRRDAAAYNNQRISFYSLGLATDLTKLETCVANYMTALDALSI